MNDQDLIRKAVELADGWEFTSERYPEEVMVPEHPDFAWVDTQYALDALAAQLVRQVELTHTVHQYNGTVSVYNGAITSPKTIASSKDGPDRTMNTLRAIVESGVLDE